MVRFIKDYYHNNSAKLLLSVLFFVLALVIFAVITNEIILEKEETIDFLVFEFFKKYLISDQLTCSMYAITQLSSVTLMKIAYPLLIGILVLFKFYRKALFTFVAGTGGLFIIYVMKMFFERPRPPYPILYREESFSFPSGHATFSFIFYGTLAYFMWLTDLPKIWKNIAMTFLVLLSLMIGFSRVYLHVHYASDVLGGFCLGYSWLFLMIYTFRRYFPLN
ncbi:phosphatase PAP2 family protein [Chryseobacterium sp. SNU WT5]|uniref:phosphatase PAP2 family protein n=1 Tax=Chryseobacterium sp. SNU WT5 TaxID=2594269 RepID=UPI00117FA1BC|nr:phosphatase PAP2 family protein [Chryseobacterium sp. SNU WT5]QDP84586.1 phosphatase PAP2 family protein [Chryseobacterium sp. SNU WT5]